MAERASGLGSKLLAVVILLGVAWLLFKVVIGFVAGIAWLLVAVLAVVAVLWAVRTL